MRGLRAALVGIAAALAVSGCGGEVVAPDPTAPSSRLTAHPLSETDAPAGYYEYLPPGYGDGEPRPLLVTLHGIGENGDGSAARLDRLLATGIPELIATDRWPDERPFVVLSPQHLQPRDDLVGALCARSEFVASCRMRIEHDLPEPPGGAGCTTARQVREFLAFATAAYDVDPERVYLVGLSCGAFAGYEYVAQDGADVVAALVAIAGDARPAWRSVRCDLGAVPIWGFHGDADPTVDPAGTIAPIEALAECPAAAELTVYPGVGHDSWTRTVDLSAGHDIYEWLLGHTRSGE